MTVRRKLIWVIAGVAACVSLPVDGMEIQSLREGADGIVPVLLSVHGDRLKGVVGLHVLRIGAEPYAASNG